MNPRETRELGIAKTVLAIILFAAITEYFKIGSYLIANPVNSASTCISGVTKTTSFLVFEDEFTIRRVLCRSPQQHETSRVDICLLLQSQ
jgi:hypothetical protein